MFPQIFAYRALTLWLTFPGHSANLQMYFHAGSIATPVPGPTTPDGERDYAITTSGLGSSPFARRYLENQWLFLFLEVLRWFTSLGSLPALRRDIPHH